MTYLTERLQPNALAEYACLAASKPDSGQQGGGGKSNNQKIVDLINGLIEAWNSCQNGSGQAEALTSEMEALIYCKARKLVFICKGGI